MLVYNYDTPAVISSGPRQAWGDHGRSGHLRDGAAVARVRQRASSSAGRPLVRDRLPASRRGGAASPNGPAHPDHTRDGRARASPAGGRPHAVSQARREPVLGLLRDPDLTGCSPPESREVWLLPAARAVAPAAAAASHRAFEAGTTNRLPAAWFEAVPGAVLGRVASFAALCPPLHDRVESGARSLVARTSRGRARRRRARPTRRRSRAPQQPCARARSSPARRGAGASGRSGEWRTRGWQPRSADRYRGPSARASCRSRRLQCRPRARRRRPVPARRSSSTRRAPRPRSPPSDPSQGQADRLHRTSRIPGRSAMRQSRPRRRHREHVPA